jgi:DNA-binding XRE family transcriptional regulator
MAALRTLKVLRVAAGLSQEKLAEEMGLQNHSTISRYEKPGSSVPPEQRKLFVSICSPRVDWSKLKNLKSAVLS